MNACADSLGIVIGFAHVFTRHLAQDDDFAGVRQQSWWADFEKELLRILPAASHWRQATQLHMRV
jgi:hypothetical protein